MEMTNEALELVELGGEWADLAFSVKGSSIPFPAHQHSAQKGAQNMAPMLALADRKGFTFLRTGNARGRFPCQGSIPTFAHTILEFISSLKGILPTSCVATLFHFLDDFQIFLTVLAVLCICENQCFREY